MGNLVSHSVGHALWRRARAKFRIKGDTMSCFTEINSRRHSMETLLTSRTCRSVIPLRNLPIFPLEHRICLNATLAKFSAAKLHAERFLQGYWLTSASERIRSFPDRTSFTIPPRSAPKSAERRALSIVHEV